MIKQRPIKSEGSKLISRELIPLYTIVVIQLAKGIIGSTSTVWTYINTDDYFLSTAEATSFTSIVHLPSILEPVWGYVSDSVRIFGYKRKSYLIITSLLSWFFTFANGLWTFPILVYGCSRMSSSISNSFQSAMCQALMVEYARKLGNTYGESEQTKAKAASTSASILSSATLIGTCIESILTMFFLTEDGRHEFMLGISFVPIVVLVFAIILPERKRRPRRRAESGLLEQDPEVMRTESYSSAYTGTERTESRRNTISLGNSNFRRAINFVRNPLILKTIFFVSFISSLSPEFFQAEKFYSLYYLQFSGSFIGLLSFIPAVAGLLGIAKYNRSFATTNLKKSYIIAGLILIPLQLSKLIQVFRLNIEVGISDKTFSIIEVFIVPIARQMRSLPVAIFLLRICPTGIEATVMAIFLGVSQIGMFIAAQLGSVIISELGITQTNFDNLWILYVISAVWNLLPLISFSMINYENVINFVEQVNNNEEEGEAPQFTEPPFTEPIL